MTSSSESENGGERKTTGRRAPRREREREREKERERERKGEREATSTQWFFTFGMTLNQGKLQSALPRGKGY